MKKTLLAFMTLVALCLISCEEKRTDAPTGFRAEQVSDYIVLTWNPVNSADEYFLKNTSTNWSEHISSTSFAYMDYYYVDDNVQTSKVKW